MYNLRSDPFERATDSAWYADWKAHRAFLLVPAQAIVGKYLESFKEFPPRAKAASFTVSDAMDKITAAATGRPSAKAAWRCGRGTEFFLGVAESYQTMFQAV